MWGFEFADITSKPESRGGSSVPSPTVPRLGPSQLVERISREVFYVCSFLEHIAQCDTGMLTYIAFRGVRRSELPTLWFEARSSARTRPCFYIASRSKRWRGRVFTYGPTWRNHRKRDRAAAGLDHARSTRRRTGRPGD